MSEQRSGPTPDATMLELARQHPDDLMRACECEGLAWFQYDHHGLFTSARCLLCGGTGRRPLTLEEVLQALADLYQRQWSDGSRRSARRWATARLRSSMEVRPQAGFSEAAALALLEYRAEVIAGG